MDLADEHQVSSMDIFTFLYREAEKMLRRFAGLSVPQSAFDGSRLAIPCPSPFFFSSPSFGSEAHVLLPPQETPAWSTFLCFSRTVSQARCSTAHAVFARSSPVF
ncbi:hypothetical protein CRENBAI_012282 [Crenichthys baileyi]|uniref:Uncharacterized protein n=1 Tax=Crenichthys baileyi TaxID=28760 RepID=A0AAV9RS44_9TELE